MNASAQPKPLCLAIVGLGSQGREHLRAVNRTTLPLRVGAVVEPRGLEEGLVLPPGCPVLEDVHAIPPEIEAVIVATPPATYRVIVPALLEKGKHILLEKPVGLTPSESLHLTHLAQRHDCLLMPAVQRRFHPAYTNWQKWKERIGDLIEASVCLTIVHEGTGWRSKIATAGGGALFDLGFHAIDLVQQLFGDVRVLSASFFDSNGKPEHSGLDVRADLLLETETFQPVRLRVERQSEKKREEINVRGVNGVLRISRAEISFTDQAGQTTQTSYEANWNTAMDDQLKKFLHCIQLCRDQHESAWESLWTGSAAMRLMAEAYAHGTI